MAKKQNRHTCKWCGTCTNYKDECQICKDKLKLIRTIKAMLLGCSIEDLEEYDGPKDH